MTPTRTTDWTPMTGQTRLLLCLAVVSIIFLSDQIVKMLIVGVVMAPPRVITVTPFFDIVLVFNRGISFGMFADQIGRFPEAAAWFKTAIVAGLLYWSWRTPSLVEATALSAMAGGAAGNIADRFLNGAVTDYLSFHLADWYWPAFNLADVAVVTGAFAIVATSLPFCAKARPSGTAEQERQ